MSEVALPFDWDAACRALSRRDPELGRVIKRKHDVRLEIVRARTPFHALTRAIIYQQLSGKAAATIHGRVRDLFPRRQLSARRLLTLDDATIRAAGVSNAKMLALRDLAEHAVSRKLPSFKRMESMPNEAIIDALTNIRGVGRWTVEMLLMFQLGRPDVMPVADLGVRKGFGVIHDRDMPTPKELAMATEHWAPWRTVAAWFCWRALES